MFKEQKKQQTLIHLIRYCLCIYIYLFYQSGYKLALALTYVAYVVQWIYERRWRVDLVYFYVCVASCIVYIFIKIHLNVCIYQKVIIFFKVRRHKMLKYLEKQQGDVEEQKQNCIRIERNNISKAYSYKTSYIYPFPHLSVSYGCVVHDISLMSNKIVCSPVFRSETNPS